MITIQGEITEQTAIDVAMQLETLEGEIEVYIDSQGGDLFAGLKIYDMFTDRDIKVTVKRAGSVASIIALAGKTAPEVESGGGFAIHNAHVQNVSGNQHDMERMKLSLERYSQIVARIYQSKTKLSNAQAVSLMNDSTTIDANNALALGFASGIKEAAFVQNNSKLISNIINIDMSLLDKVKNNLGLPTTEPAPTAAPVAPANMDEEMPAEGGGFTPEQLAEITELVNAVVAEALAGAPTSEEIGNTIAVVLNEVVSNGTVPVNAQINNALPVEKTASQAFQAKMKEIKTNTDHAH